MEKHEIRLGMAVEFHLHDQLLRRETVVLDPRALTGGTRPQTQPGMAWRSFRERGWAWADAPREVGVVVGARTLQEGYTQYGGYDEPPVWMQTGTREAVLVAANLRTKPMKFLAQDLKEIP